MNRTGFIGCGSMGSMLVNGIIASRAADPRTMTISTRTNVRAERLAQAWPGLELAENNRRLAEQCGRIFMCVKPQEVRSILEEIKPVLRKDAHLISIAACVMIADIESVHPGKVSKVIPSLTSEVREGISLVCHNRNVAPDDAACVERLLRGIGTVKAVREQDFEAAADLTSCAPGMIAALFQEFVEAGLRHSGLTRADAEEMVVQTLYGTAKLLHENSMSFEEAITRVATKGGITEEGVQVLRNRMPAVFDEVFKSTLNKHEDRKAAIRAQFGTP